MPERTKFFSHWKLKNTQGRNKVLDILETSTIPLTAEDIYLKSKEQNAEISLSTVYRILDLFVAKGIVIKSNISSNNKAMFEIAKEGHKHHIVCIHCKKVLALENCPLKCYEKTLKNKTHYDITGHKLEIFGYCPECKVLTDRK